MSNNLKTNTNIKKLNNKIENEYYIFDFKYLTNNKAYNFKCFKNDKNNKLKTYENLINKIIEISNYSTKNFNLLSKEKGLETLYFYQLKFEPNGLNLSNDDKFISIRFNSNKYRIICIKSTNYKNVLHIIGFDFNHNAYNHG